MSSRISCCTLAYAYTTTLEEAMRRISAAGYDGVDIYTGTPHLDPENYSKDDVKKVKALASKLDLAITGFALNGGRLALNLNFSNPKEQVRRKTLKYYMDVIDLAEDLGCPMINVLTGGVLYGTSREQGRKWTMDALGEVAAHAEKKNILLGMHPQILAESPLMVTIDDALDMIRELNSKTTRIIFDTSQQYLTNPNFADDIRKAREYLSYIHVNDNDGSRWLHWPPGRGVIDWPGLFRVLGEIHFDGWICCQIFSDSPVNVDGWIYDARRFILDVMKKTKFRGAKA